MKEKKKLIICMICGLLGCLCYGGGDWLMMYGDATPHGDLFWLTDGVAAISSFRNSLAMLLAFPGIILYGIGLFYLENLINNSKEKKIYHYLNVFGLTPWMCLHLFYIMILYLFSWLNNNGYQDNAYEICYALFAHLSWIVIASEIMMLPVFVYWFYLVLRKKTVLPRLVAFFNVLIIFGVLEVVKMCMKPSAFRIGFTNGLMSESMIIFFAVILAARLSQVDYRY